MVCVNCQLELAWHAKFNHMYMYSSQLYKYQQKIYLYLGIANIISSWKRDKSKTCIQRPLKVMGDFYGQVVYQFLCFTFHEEALVSQEKSQYVSVLYRWLDSGSFHKNMCRNTFHPILTNWCHERQVLPNIIYKFVFPKKV